MAKFLPFVVEKSTPIHIYQTLIARSKGMNSTLVTSILYLVLEKGITAVRETASELPDMDLNQLYETLINTYPSYRITNDQFGKMQLLKPFVKVYASDDYSDELKEFELSDVMSFLLVMLLVNELPEYSPLHFEKLFNGETDFDENHLIAADLFSNDGDEVIFQSRSDLAAYIWFHATILPGKVKPVKAVYNPNYSTSSKPSAGKFSHNTGEQEYQTDSEPDEYNQGANKVPSAPHRKKRMPKRSPEYSHGIPFPEER